MSIIYTWEITNLYVIQQPDPNYVIKAAWVLTGTDGAYNGGVGGSTTFSSTQESTFIPYDQLTQDIVLSWVKESLGAEGVANYESIVSEQISKQANPPVIPENTPLPWSN